MFDVFIRNWYDAKGNPDSTARKTIIKRVDTEEQAQEVCRGYNSTTNPGPRGRKAEYEETR